VFEPAPMQVYRQMILELATPKPMSNATGKVIVERKRQLADRSVASPDFADVLVLSLALTDQGSSNEVFVAPIVASSPRGFPELCCGPVKGSSFDDRSPAVAGGYDPADRPALRARLLKGLVIYMLRFAFFVFPLCVAVSSGVMAATTSQNLNIQVEGASPTTIDAAATYCAANGGGDGSSGNPWKAACIQAAINAASNGNTITLAAGNWRFDTGASPIATAKNITLTGAGSGNTFDAFGHPNNPTGGPQGTVTRVYESGASSKYPGTEAGGYLSFTGTGCGNITVSHIFFDGSAAINGGQEKGLLNFFNCANGTVTIDDIRVLANAQPAFGSEAQFFIFGTNNATVKNSILAEPPNIDRNGYYPNSQVLQSQWHSGDTITNNLFYQQAYNGFYLDNVTYTSNAYYCYNDGIGACAQLASQGPDGCGHQGCYNNSTTGNFHYYARNNLFSNSGNQVGIGGGVNDSTTNGIVNDQQWSGNWMIADQGYLDACIWRYWTGSCEPKAAGSVAQQVNGMSFTNNSVISTTKAAIDFRGNGCPSAISGGGDDVGTGPADCPGDTTKEMQCVNCSAQQNYLSSPNNQYLTDSNSVSPSQSNNYCTGSSFPGCNTSGFTQSPTVSFALGSLSGSVVPFSTTSFTAQYGAVKWLASTSATTPQSADSRWNYLPPVSLSGVAHGNAVYLWVMDSANHISAGASVVIP
jgi:hypothetical protein